MTNQVTPHGFAVSGRNVRKFNEGAMGIFNGSTPIKGYEKVAKKIESIRGGGNSVLDSQDLRDLAKLGIMLPKMRAGVMDSQVATQVTQSIPTPVQFLQTFLPGVVKTFQAPTKADDLIGFMQVGQWSDAEIVQRFFEFTGFAREYGDNQAKPLTQWTMNFETRHVVRFEIALAVYLLQEERASRGQISDSDEKRSAAMTIMNQLLNNVAFYGYNGGNNRTYGILTDPNLPTAIPVAATGTGSSTLWSDKTFQLACDDMTEMFTALTTQTRGRINPRGRNGHPTTLGIPVSHNGYFSSLQNSYGKTLEQWMNENYPNCRMEMVPQLDLAVGGTLNEMILFVDHVPDIESTDDKAPFTQLVQTRWMPIGQEIKVGGRIEGFTAAVAGTLVKYPLGIVIRTSM